MAWPRGNLNTLHSAEDSTGPTPSLPSLFGGNFGSFNQPFNSNNSGRSQHKHYERFYLCQFNIFEYGQGVFFPTG